MLGVVSLLIITSWLGCWNIVILYKIYSIDFKISGNIDSRKPLQSYYSEISTA